HAVEIAGRVDGLAGVGGSEGADAIEVLETQADRIHHLVAALAGWVHAVLGEPLSHGAGSRLREYRDLRRGRRDVLTEQHLSDELSALRWRAAGGLRVQSQKARLTED